MAKQDSGKKATAGKTTAKAPAAKAGGEKKASSGRGANSALSRPVNVSADLQAIVGGASMPRTEVTKKVWDYIKANKLQDPKEKRNINADAKLEKIFGKKSVNMFEMTKLISGHLK